MTIITAESVAERAAAIRERIRGAGGDPDAITLVAVTKGQPDDAVRAALGAGLVDLGENYAQHLVARAQEAPPTARWHFLGPVQRNKVKVLAPHVALWHGIERIEAGDAIARHRPGASVLVQVNTSGEPQKHGCRAANVADLVGRLRALGLDVAGLMTVGPAGPAEGARTGFRALHHLASELHLRERSMGMSHDLEVAVQEGATIVRIGTDLFGPRPQSATARR